MGFIISKDNYFRQIKATKRIRLWEIATQLHRIGCTFALDILKLNFREYIRWKYTIKSKKFREWFSDNYSTFESWI